MNLETSEQFKLEYAEVGRLQRHYSAVRATLTTFCMTASLTAFASRFTTTANHYYLTFIGFFMLAVAVFACIVFSYRCEKANLYAADVWRWFGTDDKDRPLSFYQYDPRKRDILSEMYYDEMNWAMLLAALMIAGAFFLWK